MRVAKRTLGVVALTAPILLGSAVPAQAQGANVIECSAIFSYLGGVILFQPNGDFKANCWGHAYDGNPPGPPVQVTAVFDCSEPLPGIPPEWLKGIQVVTASGNILTNCHVHVGGGPP